MMTLADLRHQYHREMHETLYGLRQRGPAVVGETVDGTMYPVYTNADSHNKVSVVLAAGVAERLEVPPTPISSQGTTLGARFEAVTREFVQSSLGLFTHLQHRRLTTGPGRVISEFAQYAHLGAIQAIVEGNPQLQAALGGDYLVKPDIHVMFDPFADEDLDMGGAQLGDAIAANTSVRAVNSRLPILHASISCKWTMRRDRAQNTRLEALNLVRNRKGRLPHIAAVTMECDPEILGSLCLGTGDIDCVYHGALYELVDAAEEAAVKHVNSRWAAHFLESLQRMIDGSRLRDISDLPLDLLA